MQFEVRVFKEYLKFSAAHFIAYRGFRERLHGHNYQVSVRIEGDLGADGYVLDFGDVKKAAKQICDRLDERILLPMRSDCLEFEDEAPNVRVTTEEGAVFLFPESDVLRLPIIHSSAEELAQYVLGELREILPDLASRGAQRLEVGVGEAPGQVATCSLDL